MSSRLSAQTDLALVCTGEPASTALNLPGRSAKEFEAIIKIAALSVIVMITRSIIVEYRQRHEPLHCPSLAIRDLERRRERKLVVVEMILYIAASPCLIGTYGLSFVGGPISWRSPLAF